MLIVFSGSIQAMKPLTPQEKALEQLKKSFSPEDIKAMETIAEQMKPMTKAERTILDRATTEMSEKNVSFENIVASWQDPDTLYTVYKSRALKPDDRAKSYPLFKMTYLIKENLIGAKTARTFLESLSNPKKASNSDDEKLKIIEQAYQYSKEHNLKKIVKYILTTMDIIATNPVGSVITQYTNTPDKEEVKPPMLTPTHKTTKKLEVLDEDLYN